ncbi:MAG: cytochrome c3 family protein [Deltaproteobacteria bacterium]
MRRSTPLLGLLVTAAVSLVTLTSAVFFERGPDPVVFPPQQIPIYFPHNYHVRAPDEAKGTTGEGLSCTFCHENIEESAKSSDEDIPGHGTCDTCHDEWIGDEDEPAPIEKCGLCHTDLDARKGTVTSSVAKRMIVPKPNIIFPHSAHTEAEVACVECHDRVPTKTVATRDDYPTMDRCIACHEDRGVSTACTTCHLQTVSGRIQTKYSSGELKPNRYHLAAIHEGDFLRTHAVPAQRDQKYCDNCHTKSECLECHDGIGRDVRYHPGDWISTHYLRARKDDMRCQSCHRFQTFCLNCHIRSGVASVTTPDNVAQRRTIRGNGTIAPGPHPMGPEWTGVAGNLGQNFHGFHAQRNIRACVSCHQEQYCLQCHTTGGLGGNPHGPNPQRLKGSTASKRNARACLKCHDPADNSWR